MNYQYRITYELLCPLGPGQLPNKDMRITAPTPVRAMDIFHKNVQSLQEKTMAGMVTRPKLKPEDYKVHNLFQIYPDSPVSLGGTGLNIEALIDLPASPNPDTKAKIEAAKEQQVELGLDDASKPIERNHEEAQKAD